MKFKFYPESYNLQLINEKGISEDLFLKLQIKYKNEFEKLLTKIIDFKKIDEYIESYGRNIPSINDYDYNFYHKYSVLESKYIYFRNNIHIENLSLEEIKTIINSLEKNIDLDINFLFSTFKKVLYEDGNIAMFGLSTSNNRIVAKSIVFEFAYNQVEFTDVSQYNFVNQIKNVLHSELKRCVNKVIDTEVDMLIYDAIPDIYALKNDKTKI